jgi:acetyltransferase-like isoleucine patch superfamily enzyme
MEQNNSFLYVRGDRVMKGYLRFIKELFRFNFINPKAKIGKNVRIDHFVVIEYNVEIGDNTWIGSWVHLRPKTKIGHDSEIRDHCYLAGLGVVVGDNTKILQYSNLCAGTIIGNSVFIAPRLSASNTKRMNHCRTIEGYEWLSPVVEDGVQIGINVTLVPGVRLAKDSYIGAGSVVAKDTESYGIYVGNPAKKIKELPMKERLSE